MDVRWLYGVGMASFLAFTTAAWATPGKVDAQGCHQSAKAGHHCHNHKGSSSAGQRASSSGSAESPQVRERRLLRECKGRPNAGACLGYANATSKR